MDNSKITKLIEDNLTVSLRQFSKEVGISRQCLYNITENKSAPTIATIKKICEYFKVDYHDYV